ncbi:hypothetical protein [Erythrobacter sp. THAF29]|uniref:hypothetical protein n=1 Tax=Erythrobacter sp. THAF29 TaxID=2587851 RepID=UPI001268A8E1|nr:hypothetical protein [Erythrobacter sp. THAF29]QFT76882.1 hypothetical protein FIU90_04950 [Erythrobacter sp. THAF29]
MTFRPIIAAIPLMLLVACGDNDPAGEEQIEQGGEAAGEVLGGTISDAMLPLGELTSQSPPAERSATDDDGASSAASSADDEPESEEAEAAPPAAPAPEVAPSPASTPTVAPPLEN